MACIRTGAQIYIAPHNLWAVSDAFEVDAVKYFRIAGKPSAEPLRNKCHFTIWDWHSHFEFKEGSVIICGAYDEVRDFGYDGIPVDQVKEQS